MNSNVDKFSVPAFLLMVFNLVLHVAYLERIFSNYVAHPSHGVVILEPFILSTPATVGLLAGSAIWTVKAGRGRLWVGIAATLTTLLSVVSLLLVVNSLETRNGMPPMGATIVALAFVTLLILGVSGLLWAVFVGARKPTPAQPETQLSELPAQQQPVWKAEEAVGLHWSRAGDAASGGAGTPYVAAQSPNQQPAQQNRDTQPTPWSRGGQPAETKPAQSSSAQSGADQGAWAKAASETAAPEVNRPWTTAAEQANGIQPGEFIENPRTSARRPAPDWTPLDPDQQR